MRWDERRIKLSQILEAIAAIGYRAHPYDAARSEQLAQKERRAALWRLFVAGFGMMQVMMYAVPVYLADEGDMTPDIEQLMRWASLILTLPVMLYSAAPFFSNAWRDLQACAASAWMCRWRWASARAFAASVWATLTAAGEVYFDSVTMFVFFLLGGPLSGNDGAAEGGARRRDPGAGAAGLCRRACRTVPARDGERVAVADSGCRRRRAGRAGRDHSGRRRGARRARARPTNRC